MLSWAYWLHGAELSYSTTLAVGVGVLIYGCSKLREAKSPIFLAQRVVSFMIKIYLNLISVVVYFPALKSIEIGGLEEVLRSLEEFFRTLKKFFTNSSRTFGLRN